jgi:hypothetical protein
MKDGSLINIPRQLECSRKTSGKVKLVNLTKENRKSLADNSLVETT